MIVVDASAVVEAVIGTPAGDVMSGRMAMGDAVGAPAHMPAEVVQVLRRLERARVLGPERALEAVSDLGALRVSLYSSNSLLDRIWTLRHAMSAYDAAYVALAEALEATLITRDRRLAAAAIGICAVELPTG
ncbi:MAG: type II toxin-antitoxin system VapC family toxin [Thermoleophilia bacterium]